jgi:O-antigen/teichoic acid export membrane protein
MTEKISVSLFWSFLTIVSRLAVSFGLFWLLAQNVDLREFGVATYQFTVAVVMGILVDYGFNLKLSRDLVRTDKPVERLWSALYTKLFLSLAAFVFIVVFFAGEDNFATLFVFSAAQVLNVTGGTIFPYLRSAGRFSVESALVIANNSITFFAFVVLIGSGVSGLYAFAISIFLGKLFLFCAFLREILVKSDIRGPSIRSTVNEMTVNFTFFLHAAAGYLYINVDTLLVKNLLGFESVGLYQAAMRVLLAACIFSEVLSNVFIRQIIKHGYQEQGIARADYHVMLWWRFSAIGAAIAVAYFFVLEYLVPVVFGAEYRYSGVFSLTMSVVVWLRYAGIYPGLFLTIGDKQMFRVVGGIAALVALVITAKILMPSYGLNGAAAACLVAHICINIVYFWVVIVELLQTKKNSQIELKGNT